MNLYLEKTNTYNNYANVFREFAPDSKIATPKRRVFLSCLNLM